jgi:antitoxin FitA
MPAPEPRIRAPPENVVSALAAGCVSGSARGRAAATGTILAYTRPVRRHFGTSDAGVRGVRSSWLVSPLVVVGESAVHRLRRATTRAIIKPLWFHSGVTAMPVTLTLKNIPDAVYGRLKAAAEKHRRSMNSEAIVCLEAVLMPTKLPPSERLARARELRAALPKQMFPAQAIDLAKREGRP